MNKNALKLPLLTIIGGIILRIIEFNAIKIIAGRMEQNAEWGSELFYISLISSVIIIVAIGMILRRTYDKATFFKSATLLVIYSLMVWGLSIILGQFGIYIIRASLILSLPTAIFNIITSILREFSSTQSMVLINVFVFIEQFAPYLFLLFAKKSEGIK